jgi:hypothetical protein
MIAIVTLFILYKLDEPFRIWYEVKFRGAKAIKLNNEAILPHITYTYDGKTAVCCPLFPEIGTYDLREDGYYKFSSLNTYLPYNKWEYV